MIYNYPETLRNKLQIFHHAGELFWNFGLLEEYKNRTIFGTLLKRDIPLQKYYYLTVCQKMALFILHPDEKNFNLHPAIRMLKISKVGC